MTLESPVSSRCMDDAEGQPSKREQFEDDVILEGEDGDEPNEYLELDKDSDSSVWLIKVERFTLLASWCLCRRIGTKVFNGDLVQCQGTSDTVRHGARLHQVCNS